MLHSHSNNNSLLLDHSDLGMGTGGGDAGGGGGNEDGAAAGTVSSIDDNNKSPMGSNGLMSATGAGSGNDNGDDGDEEIIDWAKHSRKKEEIYIYKYTLYIYI